MRNICLFIILSLTLGASAQNLSVRSITPYNSDLSDVWGWAGNGGEFALVTTMDEFTVVDVTDPDNPVRLDHTTVPGPNTYWRDVKTYGHFAYGVHDSPFSGQNQGLVIMDLSYLPDSMPTTFWRTDGSIPTLNKAHNIFIDEKGYAYVVGHNLGGGTLILDLTQDPRQPVVKSNYNPNYVHDCFVRNDTLWTSDGGQKFSIIDVRNRNFPLLIARGDRPGGYSHNIWVSDDGRTAFTTDESGGGQVLAHDVSDVNDIEIIDDYKSGFSVIPHNVHVKNDYLVISYYRNGVLMVDASVPDQMVEVGHYDTSPNYNGGGFNGCWGVYPYLPSGNILASDIEEGLYVLTPTYTRAVRFRGTVIDANTGSPIYNANIKVTGSDNSAVKTTGIEGKFKIGFAEAGLYSLVATKAGYATQTFNFDVDNGDVQDLVIEMVPDAPYTANDTIYGEVVAGETIAICESDLPGFQPSQVFSCSGSESSEFGSWTSGEDGCLLYEAGQLTGEYIDTICLVYGNGEEENVSLVIITIQSIATPVTENGFETGSFSLESNPVRHHLSIVNRTAESAGEAYIFAANGQLIRSLGELSAFRNSFDINDLPAGIYFLQIRANNGLSGQAKFIKL